MDKERQERQEEAVKKAKEYIQKLFKDNADGHDCMHALRVYQNALKIAEGYPKCSLFIVSMASLLHDADDHKLFDTENNSNARRFLREQQVEEGMIDQIIEVIRQVSFSQNRGRRPDSAEGMIVQDADRLDAIGAIGIARTFAYGGRHSRSMAHSLQHFYDKLLLIKDELNTEEARSMADRRHAFLEAFLEEMRIETGKAGEDNLT